MSPPSVQRSVSDGLGCCRLTMNFADSEGKVSKRADDGGSPWDCGHMDLNATRSIQAIMCPNHAWQLGSLITLIAVRESTVDLMKPLAIAIPTHSILTYKPDFKVNIKLSVVLFTYSRRTQPCSVSYPNNFFLIDYHFIHKRIQICSIPSIPFPRCVSLCNHVQLHHSCICLCQIPVRF